MLFVFWILQIIGNAARRTGRHDDEFRHSLSNAVVELQSGLTGRVWRIARNCLPHRLGKYPAGLIPWPAHADGAAGARLPGCEVPTFPQSARQTAQVFHLCRSDRYAGPSSQILTNVDSTIGRIASQRTPAYLNGDIYTSPEVFQYGTQSVVLGAGLGKAGMNWDLVRQFVVIADAGSLMQAARASGVSQPTLSRNL